MCCAGFRNVGRVARFAEQTGNLPPALLDFGFLADFQVQERSQVCRQLHVDLRGVQGRLESAVSGLRIGPLLDQHFAASARPRKAAPCRAVEPSLLGAFTVSAAVDQEPERLGVSPHGSPVNRRRAELRVDGVWVCPFVQTAADQVQIAFSHRGLTAGYHQPASVAAGLPS